MQTTEAQRARNGRRRAGAPARCGAGLLGALLILPLLGGGCIFDTREPEGGPGGPQVEWVNPETMGNALGNMQRALEAKVLTNYGRSFSEDGLEMILDAGDEAELGGNPFDSWSAAQEEQRMSGIVNSAEAELEVRWTVRDSVDETSSERYYEDLEYLLTFEKADSVAEYSGQVDLWFEDDGAGLWFITKWIDKRDGSGRRTWGWLRASNKVEFEAR
ncbi:MAG: hypothetical protein GF330_11680 [Candidatus Eisenbacteria bacterium]|nr:hypothetical protein [Candidatus Eisenbacteria bacterium]